MGAARRWQAAALAALGALALLGLAALPAPRPPRAPRPRPAPLAPPAAHPPPQAPRPANASTPAPPAPAVPPVPARPPAAPPAAPREPGAVYVTDVYRGGHARAHPELCAEHGARLQLLVLVTSAPAHAAARSAVRLTWGHYALRSDVALAFVLGAPPPALAPALAAEDALYNDLIVGNFVDAYSNLTLKTISMLEWTARYCEHAPRLLKTDDDMFVNVPKVLAFATEGGRRNATKTIWGRVVKKSLPKRTTRSKYFVSYDEWAKSKGAFPDFTTGPAYLATGDCVAPLLRAALGARRRYLRLEDVFVTGVLAAEAGVRRVHAPVFYNRKLAPHPCAIQRTATVHMVRYHEQFDFWRKLLDGKTKCAS